MSVKNIGGANVMGFIEFDVVATQSVPTNTFAEGEDDLSPVGSDKILPDFGTYWRKSRLAQAFESTTQIDKSYSHVVVQADKLIARGTVKDTKVSNNMLSGDVSKTLAEFNRISLMVNGGTNGYNERIRNFKNSLNALNVTGREVVIQEIGSYLVNKK